MFKSVQQTAIEIIPDSDIMEWGHQQNVHRIPDSAPLAKFCSPSPQSHQEPVGRQDKLKFKITMIIIDL